jgi:hypothetical protein
MDRKTERQNNDQGQSDNGPQAVAKLTPIAQTE